VRTALADKRPVAPTSRAFSLAELMIAIVILGLGLLFIAAALPVGLSYTRDTLDLAAGEATSEYALDTIEQYLRTSNKLIDDPNLPLMQQQRLDNLSRPRDPTDIVPPPVEFDGGHEPVIKVRPLIADNIDATPGADLSSTLLRSDLGEELIRVWLPLVGVTPTLREVDYQATGAWGPRSLFWQPALASVARVYAPITPVFPFTANQFLTNDPRYPQYAPRYGPNPWNGTHAQELRKALDRRVVWTAFYRRVSYDPGPDLTLGNTDDASDPLLYEVIVVVARRPSVNHRFPRQDAFSPLNIPRAVSADPLGIGLDRLAPDPWLVTFDVSAPPGVALPLLNEPADYVTIVGPPDDRVLQPPPPTGFFIERPTLTFRCTLPPSGQLGLGALLPVGSIFIPAVNWWNGRGPGFVPHAPDALPIYEVVERPDETTVIVKNNGFYPWIDVASGLDARAWPVWVIPPAFRERDSTGQPVYERRSPILAVARRYIRLREID